MSKKNSITVTVDKMYSFRAADFFPAIICVTYYLVVLLAAEVSRKAVDLTMKKHSMLYVFAIELIGTAQMCTCVYENTIMVKYYGVWGFFLAVACLLSIGALINRGAFISPLMPIEMFMRSQISAEKFLTLLLAETIGGSMAFRLANTLWYYSLAYSMDHHAIYDNLPCSITYKVPFHYAICFEVVGSFLLRFILHRLPAAFKQYLTPVVIAGFLSFALAHIGVPGLNPVVASSRLQGCPGLDLQWFIIVYWVCPVLGWLLASRFDGKRKSRSSKEATGGGKKKN